MLFVIVYTFTGAVALWALWRVVTLSQDKNEINVWWLEAINALAVARDDIDHLMSENRALRMQLTHKEISTVTEFRRGDGITLIR